MQNVKKIGYSDICLKLFNELEIEDAKKLSMNEMKLEFAISRTLDYFKKKLARKYKNVSYEFEENCNINEYLNRARKDITEWNFSYDEALQITNYEFGYNRTTDGVWDRI